MNSMDIHCHWTKSHILLLRSDAPDSCGLRPGDVIVYRGHDGRLYIRRVKATDGDQVSVAVSGGGSDEVIAREAIKGKTIWKFDPGEEIKRIVQEISDGRAAPEE